MFQCSNDKDLIRPKTSRGGRALARLFDYYLIHQNSNQIHNPLNIRVYLVSSFSIYKFTIMEAIIKAIDSLPRSVKIFVGAMMGLQALAIGSWLIMMLREGRSNEKEKQS